MKYHSFPYDTISGIEIPDSHSVQIYHPKKIEQAQSTEDELISGSLNAPIGMPLFTECVKPSDRVLVIVDDVSRPTPVALVLPHLLKQLHDAGVEQKNVRFLIALGTHRPMTDAEIAQKVGADVARQYSVINHEWANPDALHQYGTLSDGSKVILNRAMNESDFVVGVGSIAPHPAAGFSGGGKIIAPGVATEDAVGTFHWKSVQVPQRDVLGVRENPMRVMIDEIAEMAGLSAIINLILDGHNRVIDCFAGHPVDAHRKGCERALEIFGVEIQNPEQADIFIADTHPLDQDLWQGVKAMCALDCVVPDGAVVILVTPAPEGIASMHPEVAQHGYVSLDKARRMIEEQGLSLIAAHNMVQGGRLVERTTALMVCPSIPAEDISRLGYKPFTTAQEALDHAIQLKGESARIVILEMGGEICPVRAN